jgi:hypothetical protein
MIIIPQREVASGDLHPLERGQIAEGGILVRLLHSGRALLVNAAARILLVGGVHQIVKVMEVVTGHQLLVELDLDSFLEIRGKV